MRLLIKLKAKANYSYDSTINHKIQGFIYNCLIGSFFEDLHEKKGSKYFCFSNIFPIGDIKKDEEVNLIISSPIDNLISILKIRIQSLDEINIGEYSFKLSALKLLNIKIKSRINILTGTPIVIRIPNNKYKDYNIKSKRPYEYWRKELPLNIFIDAIEENFIKKYNSFYGTNLDKTRLFEKYELKKEVSMVIDMPKQNSIIVGSIWKFSTVYIDEKNMDLFNFLIDSGLGEMNSLGYGFLNEVKVYNS